MPDPRIKPIEPVLDTFALVTPASALVLAANGGRAEADFTNTGEGIIFLARGHVAVIGSGQCLYPAGSYHITLHNLFLGDIYAIATEDSNLSISEGTGA